MDATKLEALGKEFEVSIKPGQGNYPYVKTHLIIERLNTVFQGDWSTTVIRSEMIEDEVLVHVQVCTRDDKGHTLSCHDGFGSAKKFRGTEIGNLYKSAKSKAIKDAVKNWGVALSLDDYEGSSSAPSAMPSSSVPPSAGSMILTHGEPVLPTSMVSTPAPVTSTPPPAGNVPPSTVQVSVAPVDPVVTVVVPPTPSTPPASNSLPSTPPANVNTISTPPSGATNTAGAPTGLPNMGASVPSNTGGDTALTKITNVQEVAIQSKLDHKSLDFATTAREMFESTGRDAGTAPATLKDLSYQDALGMVNFVTNK